MLTGELQDGFMELVLIPSFPCLFQWKIVLTKFWGKLFFFICFRPIHPYIILFLGYGRKFINHLQFLNGNKFHLHSNFFIY